MTGLTLTSPGHDYVNPTVQVTGAGTGATALATATTTGAVTSVTIDAGGGGYTTPSVSFGGGGAPAAVVTVGNSLISRANATDYATAPGTLGPVFVTIPIASPATGEVTAIKYFNQATRGGSPNNSEGNVFYAYVLHATAVPGQYTVAWASGLQTVPAHRGPVGTPESILVPNIPVAAGDAIAFSGEGIPVDIGVGTDVVDYPCAGHSRWRREPLSRSTGPMLRTIRSSTRRGRTRSLLTSWTRVLSTPSSRPWPTCSAAWTRSRSLPTEPGYSFPTVGFDLPDAPNGIQAQGHAVCAAPYPDCNLTNRRPTR